jgi:ABC-type branched-subunit amino acid transport system substrate-binding protein
MRADRNPVSKEEGDPVRARWWAIFSVLLAALVLGVSACGGDDDDEEAEEAQPAGEEAQLDLVIGDIVPLTGDLADFGPPGRKAADLAFDEIEAAIQDAGVDHTVEIIHEDEQTNPQATVAAGRSLVGDGATCIAGAWASADSIPLSRSVATREEVLQISPASTSVEITDLEDDGFTNRSVTPDSFQASALADFIADELGGAEGTVINIGARNDPYGTGFTESFRISWEEAGGQIGEEVIYDPEQPSYDSEAQQLVSGNPDGLVIIDFPETYAKVGPALARTGEFDAGTTFITDGLADTGLPKLAGDEATEGLRGSAPGTVDVPAGDAFDKLYTQAPGPERQTFDAQNFDAVILCYLAAVAAGSTEGPAMAEQVRGVSAPPGTQFTWEELPQAIEALQNGEDIDYEGASGPIDMDETGDATATVYKIVEFRNGELETLDLVPLAPLSEAEAAP